MYEYVCQNPKCGKKFERIVTLSNTYTQHCPECDGKAKKIEFSVPSPFQWAPGARWN